MFGEVAVLGGRLGSVLPLGASQSLLGSRLSIYDKKRKSFTTNINFPDIQSVQALRSRRNVNNKAIFHILVRSQEGLHLFNHHNNEFITLIKELTTSNIGGLFYQAKSKGKITLGISSYDNSSKYPLKVTQKTYEMPF